MNTIRNVYRWLTGESSAGPSQEPSGIPELPGSPSSYSSSDLETEAEAEAEADLEAVPGSWPSPPEIERIYHPSPRDILHVSQLLASTSLPPELIDPILELAEYWASIRTRIEDTLESPIPLAIGRQQEHVLLFRTKPLCSAAAEKGRYTGVDGEPIAESEAEIDIEAGGLYGVGSGPRERFYASLPVQSIPEPRGKHPARRITWRICSRDQGWSSERGDTYESSWTGFWGSVSRYRLPVLPARESASGTTETNAEQDEETASRTQASSAYLAAWDALQEKPTMEPQPDTDRGVFVEGDVDEDRVWPREHWAFDGTRIQLNARAQREPMEHVVVWDHRDDIDAADPRALESLVMNGRGRSTGAGVQVRALQRGDVVGLHSYAYFPGWSNKVKHAEVMIEFAL